MKKHAVAALFSTITLTTLSFEALAQNATIAEGTPVASPNRESLDRLPKGRPFQSIAASLSNQGQSQNTPLVIVDSTGKTVARASTFYTGVMHNGTELVGVWFGSRYNYAPDGYTILSIEPGMNWSLASIMYLSRDCTGTPLISPPLIGTEKAMLVAREGTRLVGMVARQASGQRTTIGSYWDSNRQTCMLSGGTSLATPIEYTVDVSTLGTPPFYLK